MRTARRTAVPAIVAGGLLVVVAACGPAPTASGPLPTGPAPTATTPSTSPVTPAPSSSSTALPPLGQTDLGPLPDVAVDAGAVTPALRSRVTGPLLAAGATAVDGVDLPSGHLVAGPGSAGALLWVSDDRIDHVGALLVRLEASYPRTGLWPVALQGNDLVPGIASSAPWWTSELDPTQRPSVPLRAAGVELADWYRSNLASSDTDAHTAAADLGPALGALATPGGPVDTTAVPALAGRLGGFLALVPVRRPADVTAALGWLGATNYLDPYSLGLALRSWEDRYGAEPVRVGADYLQLAVRRPPRTDAEALAAAREHFAVCPDVISQNDDDLTPAQYAHSLVGATSWICWFD